MDARARLARGPPRRDRGRAPVSATPMKAGGVAGDVGRVSGPRQEAVRPVGKQQGPGPSARSLESILVAGLLLGDQCRETEAERPAAQAGDTAAERRFPLADRRGGARAVGPDADPGRGRGEHGRHDQAPGDRRGPPHRHDRTPDRLAPPRHSGASGRASSPIRSRGAGSPLDLSSLLGSNGGDQDDLGRPAFPEPSDRPVGRPCRPRCPALSASILRVSMRTVALPILLAVLIALPMSVLIRQADARGTAAPRPGAWTEGQSKPVKRPRHRGTSPPRATALVSRAAIGRRADGPSFASPRLRRPFPASARRSIASAREARPSRLSPPTPLRC